MPQIELTAADGTPLEGRLVQPDDPHGGVAVVCHPHPEHGGSMGSWMVPVLQRALVDDGWTALTFNFRGVGDSGGSFGGGLDELADVAGAVDRVLEGAGPDAPVLLVGWSFGAHVSLRHALDDKRVRGWGGIGLPAGENPEFEVPELDLTPLGAWPARKLFVHGSEDQFTSLDEIQRVVDATAEPKRLYVVEGGDHFLAGHGDVLGEQTRELGREVREG